MASYQAMSPAAPGLVNDGEENAESENSRGIKTPRPVISSWTYKDFTLYDTMDFEHPYLQGFETQAGGYPQELELAASSYQGYTPASKYCGDACEHNLDPLNVTSQTSTRDDISGSARVNYGCASSMVTAHDTEGQSRTYRCHAVAPDSHVYSTTSTLPTEMTNPTALQTWASTRENHEAFAHRVQRPHNPPNIESSTPRRSSSTSNHKSRRTTTTTSNKSKRHSKTRRS